jgi:hypothetical protein
VTEAHPQVKEEMSGTAAVDHRWRSPALGDAKTLKPSPR